MSIKLVAMDLDGTITQHKSKLEDVNRRLLDLLGQRYRLLIVGAGSCNRIFEQLDRYPVDIIGNYGMQYSEIANGEFRLVRDETAEVNVEAVTKKVDLLRRELGFTSYAGDTVEIHASGMITFPLIGTKADLADKLAFDPDRKKRRPLLKRVREAFDGYTVFVGGTSSFDIVPKPYDKLYALEAYSKLFGIERDEIVYIGDDYGEGGNDEQLYTSDIRFIALDDYRDFGKACKELLQEVGL